MRERVMELLVSIFEQYPLLGEYMSESISTLYGYVSFASVDFESEHEDFDGVVVHIITGSSLEEFQANIDMWDEQEIDELEESGSWISYEVTPFGVGELDDIPFDFEADASTDSPLESHWWGPNQECTVNI